MTSIIKVQNIQYTDGDAALTIADGGIVTGHNTLNVSHGTTGNNVATFINTSGNNNTNGVVHVKQTGATNQPTMVLEQTGEGGNSGDKQGLHIKNAGQNQGDGQVIAVTTTNSNLNSGNAFDCFRVWGNGAMSLLNAATTLMDVTSTGLVKKPQVPALSVSRVSTEQIFSSEYETITGLNSSYYNSYPVDNGSWWDSSTSKFTAPTGSGTTYHYVSLTCLYGITVPSSGNNYGLIKVRHSGTATQNDVLKAYRQVPSNVGTQGSMIFITLNACGVVKMVAGNYLQPVAAGTNGVNKRVHSGTYTNFSVIQIA